MIAFSIVAVAVAALVSATGSPAHTSANAATLASAHHLVITRLADDGTETQYPEQQEQQNEQNQQCNPNGCA